LRYRHASWPLSLACSPDGQQLVTHDGSVICLWEADTGKRVREYHGHKGRILCLAYSPDGKAISSGGTEHTFRVWDVASGRELRCFQVDPPKQPSGYSPFAHVLFTPDSKGLVTRSEDNTIRLWDIATGKEVRQFTGLPGRVRAIGLARDGKTMAAFASWSDKHEEPNKFGEVRVWEVATGKQVRRWPLPGDVCIEVFSPDLTTFVTCPRGKPPYELTVWDVRAGKALRTIREHPRDVAFSVDGKLLVTYGIAVCLWDVATGKEQRRFKVVRPYIFSGITLMPDGRTLVSWSGSNAIRFHDTVTGKELRRVEGHEWGITALAFSADGKSLASGASEDVRLWDVSAQREVRRFALVESPVRPEWVSGLALFPDGKRLLASTGNIGLHLWDVSGGPLPRLRAHADRRFRAVALSPDCTAVVTWEDHGNLVSQSALTVWDPRSWKPVREWRPGEGASGNKHVSAMALSPDGKILNASVGGDGQRAILRWDVATGQPLPALAKPARSVEALASSPDGRLLAAVEWFDTIRLWETATGQQRAVAHLDDNVHAIAFSTDGRFLATANRGGFRRASKDGKTGNENLGKVCLVDVATLKVVHRFAGHRGGVYSLAFSPDGKLLASGGSDTTVLVWDMAAATRGAIPRAAPPGAAELEAHWADLAGADGTRAHRAVWALAAVPERSIPFLKERLRPATEADAKQVARLLADLNSPRWKVRDSARRELERLSERAAPALRRAHAAAGSLEFRRRVYLLLAKLDGPVRLPEGRRALRAVEALEHMSTHEARALLEVLAAGVPQARLTQEARASLERLRQRTTAAP
jgi:WD40 repeat protein